MPRNGSGTYSLPAAAGNPVVTRTVISSSWANSTLTDIATALTQSLARDGQSAPTANLPLAGFRFTGAGDAAAGSDFALAAQVQNGTLLRCTEEAAPSANVYTANLPFGQTTFENGQMIVILFPETNTATDPTLNINGSTDWPILREDGTSVIAGDLHTAVPSLLMFNGNSWILVGSASGNIGVTSFNSRVGDVTLEYADIFTALGYDPMGVTGGTFTGPIVLSGNATVALNPVSLQQLQAGYLAKTGGTLTGTLNGTDVAMNRYLASAPTTVASGTLDFSTNQTLYIPIGAPVAITAVTGLAARGQWGKVIFFATQNGPVTWAGGGMFLWDQSSLPTPYAAPDLDAGTQKIAIVTVTRLNSGVYLMHCDIY